MNKRFGLLGETLSYSLSPKIHQMIYDTLSVEATYELVEIPMEAFAGELTRARLKRLDGFNVTTPYKELIFQQLDDIDPIAARIGAVNTVINENGKFKGYNTDYYGFMISISTIGFKTRHRAVVLGTGGAAKMAVIALEDLGFEEIVILSRNPNNARLKFEKHTCIDYDLFNRQSIASDLLVNCTPVGQKVIEVTETIENEALSRQGFLFDLNYTPLETPLLAQGHALGIRGKNGIEMLVAQAVKANEIWLHMPHSLEKITREITDKILETTLK